MELLRDIYQWTDGHDDRCLFWLNGLAGTGKSTISRTVARRCFEQQRLGASFFFSRDGEDVSHAGWFVTSIAVQLANSVPNLYQHICRAITERANTHITNQSLRDQWHQLVLQPLLKLDGKHCHWSYIVVVDALDECDEENNIRIILQLLAEVQLLKMVRLRVFLTSRSETPIRHSFFSIPETKRRDFTLHHISPSTVDHDIFTFLKCKLRLIGQQLALEPDWPPEEAIRYLLQQARGLFIWAATACRFIDKGKRFAAKRLQVIIDSSNSVTAPERHLNEIYYTVLKHSIYSDYTDEEKNNQYRLLRYVLGSIIVLSFPLSTSSLARLLNVLKPDVDQTLEDLHAILDIPLDQTKSVRLHHPSFRDFLLDKARCKDPNFLVDEQEAHQMLAANCIQLLSSSLGQDIYELDAPGTLIADIDSSRIKHRLPSEVQYACLHWIHHLQKSGTQLYDNDQLHQFLQQHLLHWLEALSWMQAIPQGVRAIASLKACLNVCYL